MVKRINIQFHSDFTHNCKQVFCLFIQKKCSVAKLIYFSTAKLTQNTVFTHNIKDSLLCHLDRYLNTESRFISQEQVLLFAGLNHPPFLTNIIGTVTNVGRNLFHALIIQHSLLFCESVGQFFVYGPTGKNIYQHCRIHVNTVFCEMVF